MQKSGLVKSSFVAAWLVASGWMFAAPAPIQRGPLKHGAQPPAAAQKPAAQKPAPQKPAVQKPAPQKPAVQKPGPSKPAPPKATPAKKPLHPKVTAPVRKPQPAKPVPAAASYVPRAPYRGAIAVDADTGRILFSDNMHTPGYPASVTKGETLAVIA